MPSTNPPMAIAASRRNAVNVPGMHATPSTTSLAGRPMPNPTIISNIRMRSIHVVYGSFGSVNAPTIPNFGSAKKWGTEYKKQSGMDEAIGIDPVDEVGAAFGQGP